MSAPMTGLNLRHRIAYRWRSSVTGRFVKRLFAKLNPRETIRERADQDD